MTGSDEDWGGWKNYMGAKVAKLDQQFTAGIGHSAAVSQIFKNIAIFVNGYTRPVASELKRLMQAHGGKYHSYRLSTTTHIVASNLAYSKLQTMRSKGELVVKPEWITDSIQAGQLLSEEGYCLSGKPTILEPSPAPSTEPSSGAVLKHQPSESVPYTASSGGPGTEPSSLSALKHQASVSASHSASSSGPSTERSSGSALKHQVSEPVGVSTRKRSAEPAGGPAPKISPMPEPEASAEMNISVAKPNKNVPATTDDNFVKGFYANSRLHFISTLAQEMKDYFRKLKSESADLQFPGKDKLKELTRKTEISAEFIPETSFYAHVDMDCFFVSVGLTKRPHLVGKPVVICHSKGIGPAKSDGSAKSDSTEFKSHAEIASCSYEARKFGVKNGMFLGSAKKLCPDVIPIPYDFEEYRDISQKLYEIVLSYTDFIEPVSCDEMYVDIGDLCREVGLGPPDIATEIRDVILEKTGCNASVGMGPSMLAARMATKRAKPNGQFVILPGDLADYMKSLDLKDLPGIGYATMEKLDPLGLVTCQDFIDCPKPDLVSLLGAKTVEKLLKACVGEDDRKIDKYAGRKSISCTINYGIRLKTFDEADKFLSNLSDEISNRMKSANVVGKQVTLQLLIRAKNAPIETTKFLGCGHCDAMSKSADLRSPTDDSMAITREATRLLSEINPMISDLRGIGIAVHKLAEKGKEKVAKPLSSFFEPRKSPRKVKFSDFESCSRPFGSDSRAQEKKQIQMPPTFSFASNIDFYDEQFQAMASLPKISETDIDILVEQLRIFVEQWRVESAAQLVSIFAKYEAIAEDRTWSTWSEHLRLQLDEMLKSMF